MVRNEFESSKKFESHRKVLNRTERFESNPKKLDRTKKSFETIHSEEESFNPTKKIAKSMD